MSALSTTLPRMIGRSQVSEFALSEEDRWRVEIANGICASAAVADRRPARRIGILNV